MADNKEPLPPDLPPINDFEWRSREVHKVELEHYIKQHREINDIKETATSENLSGLCISGGGVRSSTLGLGMLQAFIKANKLKYFDYLSTVSGGGYIGACLTSLLSAEPKRRDKDWNNKTQDPIINNSTKFDVSEVGVDGHNSLFTGEQYEYPNIEDAKLTTKHQLIHLRQHGEYLTPHKSITDWDVHRLLGALFGGIIANIGTFLLLLTTMVLFHHVLLTVMSGDRFIMTLQNPTDTINHYIIQGQQEAIDAYNLDPYKERKIAPKIDSSQLYKPFSNIYNSPEWSKMSTSEQLSAWACYSFSPQLDLVWLGVRDYWEFPLWFAIAGFLCAAIFIFFSRRIPYNVTRLEQAEQDYTGTPPDDKIPLARKSDEDVLDKLERRIIWWFFHIGLWGAPAAAYIISTYMNHLTGGTFNYFVMLALPLCFSLGLFLGLHMLIFLYFINNGNEVVSGWLYRSFYTGMQGGAFLLMAITFLFPIAIIMLFGGHGLAVTLSLSFVPVIVAYYFTVQSLGGRVGGGFLTNLINRLQMPLLNLSIFLFVGLTFAWVSKGMIWLEQYLYTDLGPCFDFCRHWEHSMAVVTLFFIALTLLFIMGMLVNANDVSLHYFYRDRLSEAFLRTSGRVVVKKPHATNVDDCKLMRINLRNHEDLQLQHLGDGNFRGPYHLIVTALNLQGSHDLSAKTLKSEHFLFSKYFIGSRSTGYVSTKAYKYGDTKLSTAMAISGAAVSSGMGPLSFAASNFYMTLFNLRTGYWVDNPKHVIRIKQWEEQEKAAKESTVKDTAKKDKKRGANQWSFMKSLKLRRVKLALKYPFWMRYILRELTGNLSSNTLKVNVSDGGHTGDNLGLLPLLQRRCSTIVVADFEADGSYSFASFAQAVRLAKSIYDVDINIDLTKLMPQKSDDGEVFSPSSVVEGAITYNIAETVVNKDGKKETKCSKKIGQIIYMKSSVSLLREAAEIYDESAAPPPVSEPAPVMVLNYFKRNPQFPHQTTADQYFDEVQFEAYRMLGEHIGKQGARVVEFGPLR